MGRHMVDRRVARTRAMLQDALISLILTKGYDAITVEDICDAANVGRSTFYAHYRSKEDLKRSGLDEHLRKLLVEHQRRAFAAPGSVSDRSLSFSLPMFEHAHAYKDLYRALAGGRGGSVALDRIRQILSDLVRDELAATTGAICVDEIPRELIVQYVVGAYMAVLIWWLDGGAKLSPQQIDGMFRQLATDGIILSKS
jgi:AcrR family transcriptional regulator